MEKHPHIHTLYQLYLSEEQPFRKVHRMIDLFESIIKTHTVVILSSYVQHNKLSDSAKGLLAQGLRTPSLGTWQLFSRVLFEELQKDNFSWTLPVFAGEFGTLDKALNADKTNVISFRNSYAHGATPSDDQCREDIKKFEPFLDQLLASKWLEASSTEEKEGKVVLKTMDGELSLHPVLLYRNENSAASFAFFNDLKKDKKIGLLNYPLGKHYREKDFYDEFHEYLPLDDWKKSGNNEFYQRVEELTETFKGRTVEREQLLRFVSEKHKGYFSIQGNPGIGKSALIAQFFKDLRAHEEIKNVHVVEYFIRRGSAQAQIDYMLTYLIKRTDELFPQGREIRAEDKNTWGLQQQLFEKWRLWAEHSKGQKLLFLIDGLDEGVENNVVNYLPRENFEHVLFIYGSRPGGHKSIDDLWANLPTEHHTKLELGGLSKVDIRALIYEVANKYEVERDSPWIDAVQKRSEGYPLYLKLLCNALENGSIQLNDIHSLPKEIDTFYKEILQRYARETDGDALLNCLYSFAAAKDYLTEAHLGLINKLGIAKRIEVLSTLKEVLYENPQTEDVLDYQLFHESFRSYLKDPTASRQNEHYKLNKCLDFTEAGERILDYCANWKVLEGSWEQRYALEHYALHLSESKKEARHTELLNLFQNEVYTTAQKRVLKQFDATKELYQLSLKKASELQHYDAQLEAALCLVDLKYEEANDAPRVVALVANNEIDLALKRIESFGGNDKEGLQRKFILYMLCLMELTLLESKEKPFRKEGIEKLLKHLDEHLRVDHSILKWSDFFSSYIIFKISCEISQLGLSVGPIMDRTIEIKFNWIKNLTFISDFELEVILEMVSSIKYPSTRSWTYAHILRNINISNKNISEEFISRALTTFKQIESIDFKQYFWEKARREIISALIENSQKELVEAHKNLILIDYKDDQYSLSLCKLHNANLNFSQSLDLVESSKSSFVRFNNYIDILKYLNESSDLKLIKDIIEKCEDLIYEFDTYNYRCESLLELCETINKFSLQKEQFKILNEVFSTSSHIENNKGKALILCRIYVLLSSGTLKTDVMESILKILALANDEFWKGEIIYSLIQILHVEKDASFINSIYKTTDTYYKEKVNTLLSEKYLMQTQFDQSKSSLFEQLNPQKICVKNNVILDFALEPVLSSNHLIGFKYIEEFSEMNLNSLYFAFDIIFNKKLQIQYVEFLNENGYSFTKANFFIYLFERTNSIFHLIEAEKLLSNIENIYHRNQTKAKISISYAKNRKLNKSIDIINQIEDVFWQNKALSDLSLLFIKNGLFSEAKLLFDNITNEIFKCRMFLESYSYYYNSDDNISNRFLLKVTDMIKQFSDSVNRTKMTSELSRAFFNQNKREESIKFVELARYEIDDEEDEFLRGDNLHELAICLASIGEMELAENYAHSIKLKIQRINCLKTMGIETTKLLGGLDAYSASMKLKQEESKFYFLKGWVEELSIKEVSEKFINEIISEFIDYIEIIEVLFLKNKIKKTCQGILNQELINRLNRTLNIQWAVDIKTQFPQTEEQQRHSTNIAAWLHEIADEDDRERAELLAMKVAKGTMTEQEFSEKLKKLS